MEAVKKFFLPALVCLLGLWLTSAESWAVGELRELYRGARAQAMGNAFVAIADDEQAIFMNPAGMAGNTKYRFNYLVADLDMSMDVITTAMSSLSSVSDISGDTLNTIMGKNIYGRAQVSPSLTLPNLGFAILLDGQTAIMAKNQAMPQITIGYQFTNGIQAAWGFSVGRGKGRRNKGEFRVGLGAKLMWRRGGYHLLSMQQLLNLSQNTLSEITGNYHMGYGADLGFQYIRKINSRLAAHWGMAWTDLGDTHFGEADPQRSNLSTGVAVKYELPRTSILLAYDYRNMLASTDFKKKNHFGAEIALPFLSLFGGINQTFLTYGTSFDFWMFKLTLSSYAEEQASYAGIDPERRYMLRLAMKVGI